MIKPGYIRLGIDRKVYFEYYLLENPKRADYYFDVDLFIHDLEKYEASKRLIEVSNYWREYSIIILIEINNSYKDSFEMSEIKNNQPCKAEVNETATIIKITKE